jgi:hypothetical protein
MFIFSIGHILVHLSHRGGEKENLGEETEAQVK